ncbi:MAG: hypothetical protein KF816_11390 [Melioribacteraceae bacterium]|nr:hypothetical protein [Melioribacteraceae bacterium]
MDGIVGLQQILACDVGTLSGTPAGAIAMGFAKGKQLKITDFRTDKAWPNIPMRNMKNFAVEGESFQPTMFMLKKTFDFLNGGADLQVVTPKQSASSGSEDVAAFVGNYLMGLDFEYTIAHDKRTMKWMWERAMEYENYQAFIDTFDSAAIVSISGVTDTDIEGKNYTYRRFPKLLALEAPQGTSIVLNNYQRLERKVVFKSKGTKNDMNQGVVNYYTVTIEIVGTGMQVADLVTLAGKAETPSVLIQEGNTGAYYDKIVIPAFKLGIGDEFTIGDDKRESRIKLEGDLSIYQHAFTFGTSNGGAVSDTTGTTGGTMTIS